MCVYSAVTTRKGVLQASCRSDDIVCTSGLRLLCSLYGQHCKEWLLPACTWASSFLQLALKGSVLQENAYVDRHPPRATLITP